VDTFGTTDAIHFTNRGPTSFQIIDTTGGMVLQSGSTGGISLNSTAGETSITGSTGIYLNTSGHVANLFVSNANPNGTITSLAKGDLCIDTGTPTLWQASAAASTVWLSIGTRYGARYTAQNVTSPGTANTVQQVPLAGGKVFDQANAVTGNTYTCPVAGRYIARGSVSGNIPAGSTISARINRNGATDTTQIGVNGSASATAIDSTTTSFMMCAAGDTIELWWQLSTASIPIRSVPAESYLAVDYIGPA
jgi:hypothetical protein